MNTGIATAIAGISLMLAACGGGDSGSGSAAPTPSAAAATGQYAGTVNGRQATVLVLDDGRFYTQYSVVGQPTLIAGVVAGTVSSSSGSLSNGTGIDYNLEGQGPNSVTLTGTYTVKQSMKATVAYSNGANSAFSGNYDTSYDTAPTQAAVMGTFSGKSATNMNILGGVATDSVTLTADAAGNIIGNSINCSFTGTIKPHVTGNVYDINLNFGSGTGCEYPNTSASGIGVLSGNQIHAFVQTPSKGDVLFIGSK
jgi:hypothetical protein